jgi:hypothetical protein
MAHTNEDKPKPAEDNKNEYTTPTFNELPIEHRQAYEVLKRKREEEHLQEFFASLNKDRQDNTTQVGEIKSPCSDQVEPSTKLSQQEAMLIDTINEENKNSSASMVNSVIEKAKSKIHVLNLLNQTRQAPLCKTMAGLGKQPLSLLYD